MRVVLSLLLAALAVSTPAIAGNKGKNPHHVQTEQSPATQAAVAITVTERTIIFDYVSQYRDTLVPAPGSAKPLPPGIAKKVARGGTLPPGIAKRSSKNTRSKQPSSSWRPIFA